MNRNYYGASSQNTPIPAGQQAKSISRQRRSTACPDQINFSPASAFLFSGRSTVADRYDRELVSSSLIGKLFLETSTIWIASWPKSYFFHSYLRTTISPRCRFIACDWEDQWIELFRRKLRNLTDNAPSCSYGRIRGGACPRWPGPAIPESWMISCEIANTDLQIPTCSRNWISGYTIVIE
jgi:hypothetical protein